MTEEYQFNYIDESGNIYGFKTLEEMEKFTGKVNITEELKIKFNVLKSLYSIGRTGDDIKTRLENLYRDMLKLNIEKIPQSKQKIYNNELENISAYNPGQIIKKIESLFKYLNKNSSDYETNIFKDFLFHEKLIPEFIGFLKYLKTEDYISFNDNFLYNADLKIKIEKPYHTVFGIAFCRFIIDRYSEKDIETPWILMSKYFADKKGKPLNNIQLSNKKNDPFNEKSINKQADDIDKSFKDFQDELE